MSPTCTSFIRRAAGTALVLLAAVPLSSAGAGSVPRTIPNSAPSAASIPSQDGTSPTQVGGVTTPNPTTVKYLPAPSALVKSGRLRPLTRSQVRALKDRAHVSTRSACVTTFDEDAAISWIPNGAKDTFVVSPFWNQQCGDSWVRIRPTEINHFHLLYTDPDVDVCLNSENSNGTAIGEFSRGEDCDPIDPVTEPRSYAHTMLPGDVMNIERLNAGDYDIEPFTFDRITIHHGSVRLCYTIVTDDLWLADASVGPADGTGQYCWANLTTGTYDMSQYTSGSKLVTLKANSGSNFGFDNVKLDW
jgi:hypothetical protein